MKIFTLFWMEFVWKMKNIIFWIKMLIKRGFSPSPSIPFLKKSGPIIISPSGNTLTKKCHTIPLPRSYGKFATTIRLRLRRRSNTINPCMILCIIFILHNKQKKYQSKSKYLGSNLRFLSPLSWHANTKSHHNEKNCFF